MTREVAGDEAPDEPGGPEDHDVVHARDASVSAGMTTLVFDPSARRLEGGRVLIGGHPARLLRLTPAGAALVDAWRAGAAIGASDGRPRAWRSA